MRNPFARLVRNDAPKPSLRERLTVTKAKARRLPGTASIFCGGEGFALDEDKHGEQHLRTLILISRSPL